MATAGSAKRPGSPTPNEPGLPGSAAGTRAEFLSWSGAPWQEEQAGPEHCTPSDGGRLRRRSDPERSSGRSARRDADSRKEFFISPVLIKSAETFSGKLKNEDRDETRRTTESRWTRPRDELNVLSDSENEEPISRRIRNISAFIRRTKNSSLLAFDFQRSRSCTDPVEDGGGKLKGAALPAAMTERVGIGHSSAAGVLLSSENSRSASAPVITATERRPAWRAVLTLSTPLPPPARRSVSPESNDSISEELNHFKPIVCSPCTPPKRQADGRLLRPTVVKATPRNLSRRRLQRTTSYEVGPAVLQRWRQIELDRQSLVLRSRSRSRSRSKTGSRSRTGPESSSEFGKRRRLLFQTPAEDSIYVDRDQGQDCRVRLCRLVPKDSPGPEGGGRSRKRRQKTKHLDPVAPGDAPVARSNTRQLQRDRALALRLQRQFDLENQNQNRRTRSPPDSYYLRSWRANQNHLRRGLRSSQPIGKKL